MQSLLVVFALLLSFVFAGHEPMYSMSGPGDQALATTKGEGWLGVSIQDMSPALAKSMNVKVGEGALVNDIVDDSPAKAAGLKSEDIIVEFSGTKINEADDLVRAVRKAEAGTKAQVVLIREGARKSFDVTLANEPRPGFSRGERGRAFAFSPRPPRPPKMRMFVCRESMGLTMQELTDQLGEYFGAPDNHGVLVMSVEKESSAEKAGFKAGDVIVKAGKETIRDLEDIWDEVEEYEEGQTVDFEIMRKGSRVTLGMKVEDMGDFPTKHWRRAPHSMMHGDCDGSCSNLGDDLDIEIERNIEKELNRVRPELNRLRIELQRMGKEIRDTVRQLRDKTKCVVSSVIS